MKVKYINEDGSVGRGVGFYAQSLIEAVSKTGQVEVVEDNPDLVHYTYFKLFDLDLPLVFDRPTVVTIHDLTPLVLPNLYPKGIKGKIKLAYQTSRVKRASAVITDSINSKNDIRHLFEIDEHKIFVSYLSAREYFFESSTKSERQKLKDKFNLPDKFVLTVAGGPNPNKNLVRLAQACSKIGTTLVIVGRGVGIQPGRYHPELKDLFELVKFDNVIRVGFLSDSELRAMYGLCSVYCQASLYEGFGLPLLEAMAAGVQVCSSNSSSLPEIYYEGTRTFDPSNVDQIAESVLAVMSRNFIQKAKHAKMGVKKAKTFSFDKTATSTLVAYKYSQK